MLQVPFIRENQDLVIERLAKRNIDARQTPVRWTMRPEQIGLFFTPSTKSEQEVMDI